jgi:hypothetical protein
MRNVRGFEHALNFWCGFASTRAAARAPLAARMRAFYQMPFEPFEPVFALRHARPGRRVSAPYIMAGCSVFNVFPCANDVETAIGAVGELRTLLTTPRSQLVV